VTQTEVSFPPIASCISCAYAERRTSAGVRDSVWPGAAQGHLPRGEI